MVSLLDFWWPCSSNPPVSKQNLNGYTEEVAVWGWESHTDCLGWLWNQFLQLCLLTDPLIWNVTSFENISWSIKPDTLAGLWEKLDYHLDVCGATNGANIEVYQTNKNLRTYPFTIYNHVSKKFNFFWFAE